MNAKLQMSEDAKLEMSDEVADRRVVEQKEKNAAALINWKVGILVYKRCFFCC